MKPTAQGRRITEGQARDAKSRALEAQEEASVCARAARRLISEPNIDPEFPKSAIWMQQLAALSARNAMRDVTRLLQNRSA